MAKMGWSLVARIGLDTMRSPPVVPGAYKLRVTAADRPQRAVAVQVRAQAVSTVDVR